jgi:hypothetical protein
VWRWIGLWFPKLRRGDKSGLRAVLAGILKMSLKSWENLMEGNKSTLLNLRGLVTGLENMLVGALLAANWYLLLEIPSQSLSWECFPVSLQELLPVLINNRRKVKHSENSNLATT